MSQQSDRSTPTRVAWNLFAGRPSGSVCVRLLVIPKRAAMLIGLVLVVSCLSGCALFASPPNEDVGLEVTELLRSREGEGVAVADLSRVVDSDWTTAVIVCDGATPREVREAIGFDWMPASAVDDTSFLSMIVFADDEHVHRFFSAGQDDAWVNHYYFTLCPTWAEDGDHPNVVVVARAESEIEFTFERSESDPDLSYWYVSSAELNRLAGDEHG